MTDRSRAWVKRASRVQFAPIVEPCPAGSRYSIERAPIADYEELDRRMRAGEISLAIEIPPGFGRSIARGDSVAVGAWLDGAMPARAETVRGYVRASTRTG